MKKYFVTGLILLLPLALTLMIFIFLIDLLSDPFMGVVQYFLTEKLHWVKISRLAVRAIVLVFLFVSIFFLGFIARWFFIKLLLKALQKIFSKIPLIKPIYKASKDIAAALFSSKGRKAFQHPVILQFPSKKTYCVGFRTGEVPKECQDKVEKKLSPVFIPTAPHPISGFLVLASAEQMFDVSLTNEEAVKFTVSCGMITPDQKADEHLS